MLRNAGSGVPYEIRGQKYRSGNYTFSLNWGSHRGVMKSCVSWDIMPCSPLKINRCFGGTCCFNLANLLTASRWFLAWSILRRSRWRGPVSPETSVDFQRKKRRYIRGDRTLQHSFTIRKFVGLQLALVPCIL
jgi:hypothetical protein